MKIIPYSHEHEDAVFSAIGKDPNWHMFTSEGARENYSSRLQECITYVCYEGETFAGYVRALLDDGFALYISELFVVPAMRNRGVGNALISRVKCDYSGLTVYALSDEDAYYRKHGYSKVGSVFEIHQQEQTP